nr:MAG TPA: hypothetical protein [Caudoviricetes sp.]
MSPRSQESSEFGCTPRRLAASSAVRPDRTRAALSFVLVSVTP